MFHFTVSSSLALLFPLLAHLHDPSPKVAHSGSGALLLGSGSGVVIDARYVDDGLDRRAGDHLPDKLGLAHAVGGQALHEVGVFFLGHAGLDGAGAVGRVVAF